MDMFWVCVVYVLACVLSAPVCVGMFFISVGYVLGMFWVCFGVCDRCAGMFGYVVNMFEICFEYILGMSWRVLCLRWYVLVCV